MTTKIKKYDLIFSLGILCGCTGALRGSRLQFFSYPLDWVSGGDILTRAHFVANNFKDYINKEDLSLIEDYVNEKNLAYTNIKTHINYPHDFPKGIDFDEQYIKVKEKYERRANRLTRQIEESKNVLAVYMQFPDDENEINEETLIKVQSVMQEKFQNTQIDLLYIFCDENISVRCPKIKNINENITEFVFGYGNKNDKMFTSNKKMKYFFNNYYTISGKFMTSKNYYQRFLHLTKMFFKKYIFKNIDKF